ncbi:hypothetical protein CRV018 [Nile crocodilepox virus]|uniref:Uncharacterized protein n=1 Tax=Nile crocodilepox virus (isolate Crocodylus niloticus/Zimbabwe/Ume/2001) TaxID=1289473 RepID=Q070N3_CPRVZ|nr:hypothetical protein CRV018 [Nile crocodilepox virus]ABJ08909.1 hypothetical protein CRV018 [Nile crocodilepox virus]
MVVSTLDPRKWGFGAAVAAGLAALAVGAGLMLAGWNRGAFKDSRRRRRQSWRLTSDDRRPAIAGDNSPENDVSLSSPSIFERCLPFADLRGVACRFPAACFSPAAEAGDECFRLCSLSVDEDEPGPLSSLLARRRRRRRLIGCRSSLDVEIGRSVCELGDETLARVSSLAST